MSGENQTWQDRFWSRVDRSTDCWVWTGTKNGRGYGVFTANSRSKGAHRLSWEIHNGYEPSGVCVCHRCDNPACVNPSHLFIGTHADNHADKVAKGRQARGSKNGGARLTEAQVLEIYRSAGSQDSIAKRFGVCQRTVSVIKRRVKWAWLTAPTQLSPSSIP